MAKPPVTVQLGWADLEAVLARNAPDWLSGLNGPASNQDLKAIEAALGLTLPAEVRAFFLIHNGEGSGNDCEPILDQGYLLPLVAEIDCALDEWRNLYGPEGAMVDAPFGADLTYRGPVKRQAGDRSWLPFASDFSGNFLCFDFAPADGGRSGQVLFCDYASQSIAVIATSIGDLLSQRARQLEQKPPAAGRLTQSQIALDQIGRYAVGEFIDHPFFRQLDVRFLVVDPSVLVQRQDRDLGLRASYDAVLGDRRKTFAFCVLANGEAAAAAYGVMQASTQLRLNDHPGAPKPARLVTKYGTEITSGSGTGYYEVAPHGKVLVLHVSAEPLITPDVRLELSFVYRHGVEAAPSDGPGVPPPDNVVSLFRPKRP